MWLWAAFWVLLAGVVGTFTFVNWEILTARTALNLLVAQMTAPLGLVMLGGLVALTFVYLVFLVWLETKAMLQIGKRRTSGENATATATLADLRSALDQHFESLKNETSESLRRVVSRLERVEERMTDRIEQPVTRRVG
ncbi:MAG: hypothetical protein ACT4QD_23005 [Acidobacteriota bacterium]